MSLKSITTLLKQTIFLGLKLVCPNNCGKTYNLKGSLSRHLKYECGIANVFNCLYCDKHAKQKYNLMVHVKMAHPERLEEFKDLYYKKSTDVLRKLCYKPKNDKIQE